MTTNQNATPDEPEFDPTIAALYDIEDSAEYGEYVKMSNEELLACPHGVRTAFEMILVERLGNAMDALDDLEWGYPTARHLITP